MDFASILSGIGSLAGGAAALSGGGGDGIDVSENYRLGLAMGDLIPRNIDKHVRGVTKAAKRYGYHPMYLMGSASSQSPSFQIGGSSSKPNVAGGLEALGQGAGQLARGLSKEDQHIDSASKALGLRQQNAEVLASEYRAELLYNDLMRDRQALNSMPGGQAQITAASPAKKPGTPGVAPESIPLWVPVVDRDGKIHHFPNPELGMEMPESLSAGFLLQGQRNRGSAPRGGPRPASGRPRHYLRR